MTIYGRCGEPCPSSVDCRDYIAKNYFFFLTFENSFCRDYISKFDGLCHLERWKDNKTPSNSIITEDRWRKPSFTFSWEILFDNSSADRPCCLWRNGIHTVHSIVWFYWSTQIFIIRDVCQWFTSNSIEFNTLSKLFSMEKRFYLGRFKYLHVLILWSLSAFAFGYGSICCWQYPELVASSSMSINIRKYFNFLEDVGVG